MARPGRRRPASRKHSISNSLSISPLAKPVQKARQQTWSMFPESNTWGAYQAYGDPEFRLRRKPGMRNVDNDDVIVAAEEMLIELDGF